MAREEIGDDEEHARLSSKWERLDGELAEVKIKLDTARLCMLRAVGPRSASSPGYRPDVASFGKCYRSLSHCALREVPVDLREVFNTPSRTEAERLLNQAARAWYTQAALSNCCFSSSLTAAVTSAV
jgi:hypothetical protein